MNPFVSNDFLSFKRRDKSPCVFFFMRELHSVVIESRHSGCCSTSVTELGSGSVVFTKSTLDFVIPSFERVIMGWILTREGDSIVSHGNWTKSSMLEGDSKI